MPSKRWKPPTSRHQRDNGKFINSIPEMSEEKIVACLRIARLARGPIDKKLPKRLAEQEYALQHELNKRSQIRPDPYLERDL